MFLEEKGPKEKLKKLKADLKVWNKEIFEDVNQVGEGLQKKD